MSTMNACNCCQNNTNTNANTVEKKELKKKHQEQSNESETCAICMEDIDAKTGKNVAKTNCGHTFCLTCLVRALKDNNTCPMCRTNIEEEKPGKKVNAINFEDCVRLIKDEIECYSFREHVDVITMFGNPVSALKHFAKTFSVGLVKNIIELQEEGDDYEYMYDENEFSDGENEED